MYPTAILKNLPMVGADHVPILLNVTSTQPQGKYMPFKFEAK